MKKILMMSVAMLLASGAEAAELDRDRTIVATTVIGATTGAILGQQHGRSAESAIVGGVLGAVTGVILTADRTQVAYGDPYYQYTHRPVVMHRTVVVKPKMKHKHQHYNYEAREQNRNHREYAWNREYERQHHEYRSAGWLPAREAMHGGDREHRQNERSQRHD